MSACCGGGGPTLARRSLLTVHRAFLTLCRRSDLDVTVPILSAGHEPAGSSRTVVAHSSRERRPVGNTALYVGLAAAAGGLRGRTDPAVVGGVDGRAGWHDLIDAVQHVVGEIGSALEAP